MLPFKSVDGKIKLGVHFISGSESIHFKGSDDLDNNIVVAVVSGLGTVAGSIIGILASTKLTAFRLEQLEKRVEKHNSVIERQFVLEEQMKTANHRLTDLEASHKSQEKQPCSPSKSPKSP